MNIGKMNFRGSQRLLQVSESETLAMAKYVRKLKSEGKDIISFTLGEPDFDTPDHIRQAGIDAINKGQIVYPPVAGIPELRSSVAKFYSKLNNVEYNSSQILISTGAKQGLFNTIMALVDPGDEVIIPTPFWVSYAAMVQLAGGIPIYLETNVENDFKISPQQLSDAITSKSRLFIFSSPSNPTGSVYSKAELEALAEVFKSVPDLFVISDEIYQLITYQELPTSFASISGMFDRTITINGVSKAYAMTGWRIGFTMAPEWIISLCEKYQGQVTSGANVIAQKAAITALENSQKPVEEMVKTFKNRRDLGISLVKKHIPEAKLNIPQGAFYLYLDISYYLGKTSTEGKIIQTCEELSFYLIDHGVATIPGSAFGTEDHIRISYACNESDLEKGIERIGAGLAQLL